MGSKEWSSVFKTPDAFSLLAGWIFRKLDPICYPQRASPHRNTGLHWVPEHEPTTAIKCLRLESWRWDNFFTISCNLFPPNKCRIKWARGKSYPNTSFTATGNYSWLFQNVNMATTLWQVQHIPMIFLEVTNRVELNNTSKVTTWVIWQMFYSKIHTEIFLLTPWNAIWNGFYYKTKAMFW